jgi:protein ImuB
MRAALSLYMPTLASDVVRLRRRLDGRVPVVLWTLDHQREVVTSCCAASMRAGVRAGMTVAHARALVPKGVMHAEQCDIASTRRALRRLALRMHAFVPTVAMDQRDGLLLDASGCVHLYGTMEQLIARIMQRLAKIGIAGRVAAAPTFTAACAIARCGAHGTVVRELTDIARATDELPLVSLRLQAGVLHALYEVGIERVGQMRALPRASLADRFGAEVLRVLDQLSGRVAERITPVVARGVIEASHALTGPTTRLEVIHLVAQRVLASLCRVLQSRQMGCRKVVVTLERSDIEPLALTLQVAKATSDAGHLFGMLRHLLDGAQLGFGVQGLRARAMLVSRVRHEQMEAWRASRGSAPTDGLGRLVDACVARMGPASVTWATPVASHLPENALVRQIVGDLSQCGSEPSNVVEIDRPSRLLTEPASASVLAVVPDGPLARVSVWGEAMDITQTHGPERIAGAWWREDEQGGASLSRDYFRVQTAEGRWLWVFRCRDGRWFVHGEWA